MHSQRPMRAGSVTQKWHETALHCSIRGTAQTVATAQLQSWALQSLKQPIPKERSTQHNCVQQTVRMGCLWLVQCAVACVVAVEGRCGRSHCRYCLLWRNTKR